MLRVKNFIRMLMIPFSYYVVEMLVSFVFYGLEELTDIGIFQQYSVQNSVVCAVMICIYGPWLYALRKEEVEESRRPLSVKNVWKGIVLGFGANGLSFLWFVVLNLLIAGLQPKILTDSAEHFEELGSFIQTDPYIGVFLSVVLLGPIAEELVFRGLQYQYGEKVARGWFPVVVTAICFGLFHLEPVQIVYTMLIGFLLGIVYRYTRSMGMVILIHVVNNFINALPPAWDTENTAIIINGISLLMVVPSLILLFRMMAAVNREDEIRRESLPLYDTECL